MKTQALITTTAALVVATAFGADFHITSITDFVTFYNSVNKGTNYKGTTVFLDQDINFFGGSSDIPASFTPIGTSSKYFRGTFDGQGYVISNLKLKSSEEFTGLFGYSTGLTVKNVVMDPTSSVECVKDKLTGNIYFGGIIGECEAEDGDCVVENVVNMVDLLFTGETSTLVESYSGLGGIYGRFTSENGKHDSIMRNCANYGAITHKGKSKTVYLGGLYGGCHGSKSHKCIIENCLNAGSVSFSGSTDRGYIGGLGGRAYYNEIKNCVSIGMVTGKSGSDRTGAFVGCASDGPTSFTNCVWTEDTGMRSGCGTTKDGGQASPDALSSSSSELNSTTLAILNSQSSSTSSGNKWILNSGRHIVQFFVNGALTMSTNTALVQQPDMSGSGGINFNGWYTDASCTSEYTTYETTGDLDLYGTYGVLQTITFILNDTVQIQSKQKVGEGITYPDELFNRGHTFYEWNNTGIIAVPDYDIALAAEWIVNSYTVTFDFDNGTSSIEDFFYNNEIYFPEDLVKKGHTFLEWNNTDNITAMPDYDITFTAQWAINNYTVTFDFGNGTSITETLIYNEEIDFLEDITKRGHTFLEWNNTDNITEVPDYDITFTAQWSANSYSITFDFGNGTSVTETLSYNDEIVFPEDITKKGHTFIEWNTTGLTTVPDYDITFMAQWAINNYTVTFDFGNGTFATQSVMFSDNIVFPKDLIKANHTFIGWNNTDNITEVPDYDITFTAQWVGGELNNYVEIVFNRKDITEEDVFEIIEFYGNYTFTIEKFGTDDELNTFVIIKFEDVGEAKSFVETVKAGSDFVVKTVNFIDGAILSLFNPVVPFSALLFIAASF